MTKADEKLKELGIMLYDDNVMIKVNKNTKEEYIFGNFTTHRTITVTTDFSLDEAKAIIAKAEELWGESDEPINNI